VCWLYLEPNIGLCIGAFLGVGAIVLMAGSVVAWVRFTNVTEMAAKPICFVLNLSIIEDIVMLILTLIEFGVVQACW